MTAGEPRLLVIRRDNIGDLVCTTPLLHELRRQLPEARIECLVTRYNQAVLQDHPDIDALHAYTKAKHRGERESRFGIYWRRLRTVSKLRRSHFDWLLLPGGGSASGLRFARWIGADRVLVRDEQDTVAGPHEVEQCCHLLSRMGLDYAAPPCRIVANPAEADAVRSRLAAAFAMPPRRLIALHISARKPSQRWPADSFASLARQLAGDGTVCMLLWAPGSADNPEHPGDDEKAARVLALTAGLPMLPLATRRLEELIAALSLCDSVICSDGGAMHLAAGLGKPIVALFGQSTASRWHPWGVSSVVLQKPSQNAADIPVADVLAAYRQIEAGPILIA